MDSDELINPERQNAINASIDASDRQVIERFVRSRHETKEELVSTFTYLKMEHSMEADSKRAELAADISKVRTTDETGKKIETVLKLTVNTQHDMDRKKDEDGIEEEILEEGTKSGAMTNSNKLTQTDIRPPRKFGNFVDEANSDSEDADSQEDDIGGGGYSASFSCKVEQGNKQGETTLSETTHQKIANLPHVAQPVTECDLSAVVDEQYEDGDGVDDDDDDDVEEGDCRLIPGVAEDVSEYIPSLSDLEQVTCLQMTTTGNSLEDTAQQNKDEVCTDEVEPFQLDENFDYDNVKLTPKFTTQELDYLKSFMPSANNET